MAKKKSKKKQKKTTRESRTPKRPLNWDNVISVAYLRMLGFPKITQPQVAKEVGVSPRTVTAWEAADFWPEAQEEARRRFFKGGDAASMRGIQKAFNDKDECARTSRWWLERRAPELAPPKLKAELSGPEGGSVQQEIIVKFVGVKDEKES